MDRIRRFALAAAVTLVAGVGLAAPPASADVVPNRCSLSSPGHLVVDGGDLGYATWVFATADPAQSGALAVDIDPTYAGPATCLDSGGHRFKIADLLDVTVSGINTSWFIVDESRPLGLPVISNQATGAMLTIEGHDLTSPVVWKSMSGQAHPSIDLNNDAVADVVVLGQLDQFTLDSGAGKDLIDMSAGWPFASTYESGSGDDVLIGSSAGGETFVPDDGADTVDTGAGQDAVVASYDGSPDTFVSGVAEDTLAMEGSQSYHLDPNGVADDGALGEGDKYGPFAQFIGGSGDDTFVARQPSSFFVGGTGVDTVDLSPMSSVTADCSSGTWTAFGPGPMDNQDFQTERVVGTAAGDNFHTGCPGSIIAPGGGDDQVHSTAAGTRLEAGSAPDGADTFDDSVGDGTWDYSARSAPVMIDLNGVADDGAPGEHDAIDSASVSAVVGGVGDDQMYGDFRSATFDGGPGKDLLLGRGGSDVLIGGAGQDTLVGGSGDDVLRGGDDADHLDGSQGDDEEYGDAGSDTFTQGTSLGDNGSDNLRGGSGVDTATYLGRSGGVRLSNNGLYDDGAPGEYDRIATDVEYLVGTNSADTINGGGLADRLYGNGGADTIHGYGGNDIIDGGTGADHLYGDTGDDVLYARDGVKDGVNGGTGHDRARRDSIDVLTSIEGTA